MMELMHGKLPLLAYEDGRLAPAPAGRRQLPPAGRPPDGRRLGNADRA